MVTNSLSERLGAGPGRCKVSWIIGDPFITSSTMVKMVVRTVALSSICSALLVCIVYTLKRTTVLFPCQQLAQSVNVCPAHRLGNPTLCKWKSSDCDCYVKCIGGSLEHGSIVSDYVVGIRL